MTVLITLTIAGTDSGPFALYSDLDGFTVPFEPLVNKLALQAGYSSSVVPDFTNIIRVQSLGDCGNFIDISLINTTTTTSSTSTSTTTTTSTSSTTTTTTTAIPVFEYKLTDPFATSALACAETSVFPIEAESPDAVLNIGSILYYNNTLTPVSGGGFWYNINPDVTTVYQINGSGQIIDKFVC